MSNPICGHQGCIGWLEEIRLPSGLWYRCRSCGFMKKINKRIILKRKL